MNKQQILFLLGMLMLVIQPVQAAVVADNTTETIDAGLSTGSGWIATAFTTDTNNYQLDSLTLQFNVFDATGIQIRIFTDNSGEPNTELGTALSGTVADGVQTFTASSINLSANTTYWLVVSGGNIQVASASSDAQTGWAIGDHTLGSTDSGVSWVSASTASLHTQISATVDAGDTTPPTVDSIVRAGSNPTNASSVDFTVTFSEAVTGVGTGDFVLDNFGVTGAAVSAISGSGTTYTVTVNTGTGDGSVSIDFDADADGGVDDAASNTSTADFTGGQSYGIDKSVPTLTVEQAGTDPTTNSPINFTATFNETVSGFITGDVNLSNSTTAGTLIDTVSGTGPYTIAVSGMSGHGVVVASVDAGKAIDYVNNSNVASTSTDNIVQFYATSDLVINEVDYDQPSTDEAEFIELYNKGGSGIDLSLYEIRLYSGSTNSVYTTISGLSGTLAANDYYVICGDNTKVANCDLDHSTNTDLIQNGAPDAIGLVVTATGAVLDALTYEGTLIANGDQYSEGTSAPTDPGTTGNDNKGLSRTTDGTDTNDNSSDFAVRCITPGAANHADANCTPDIDFSSATFSASEGAGTSTAVTLTRSGYTSATSSIDVTISGGTASAGSDYTNDFTKTINFAAGETSKTVPVTLTDDSVYEAGAAETITFGLTNPITAAVGTTQTTTTLSITDNDAQPTVTLGLSGSPLIENAGTATVTATLSHTSTQDVTVNLAFSGTATGSGTDYSASGSSIVISASSSSDNITLTSVHDTLDETDETVIVDISGVTNGTEGTPNQVTATISDDDSPPNLSINDVSVAENSGPASFTVSLSPASGKTVTVAYATSDGTAVSGSDYTAASGTLTFNPGDTSKTVNVTLTNETTYENSEAFTVDLSSPSNATISDNQGQGTITNDDSAPTVNFTAAANSVTESTATATITAQLSTTAGVDVSLPFSVNASSTATGGGTDYSISSSPLTISAGSNSATITITLNNDSLDEADETVVVDMGTPSNASLGATTSHTLTITDDDVSLVINELDYDQGATDNAEFIELKNISTSSIDLGSGGYQLQVINSAGTAALQTINLTGTVAANEYFVICDTTAKVLHCDQAVNLGNDFIADGSPNAVALVQGAFIVDTVSYAGVTPNGYTETASAPTDAGTQFRVGLARSPDGTDGGDNSSDFVLRCATPGAANSLTDDSNCFQVNINDSSVTEGDSGTINMDFTVTLSHADTAPVTLKYATANNFATAGSDYVAVTTATGSVTFPANSNASQTVSITINGDKIEEGISENFYVNLSSPSVNAKLIDSNATGTITDSDDIAGLTLSTITVSVNEPNTTATFTVVLDTEPTSNVQIDVTSGDTGEATVSATPALPLTFTPSDWNSPQTVTVTAVDDAISDGNQTTTITLDVNDAASDNFYDPKTATVTVTTVDNDTPGIVVNPSSLTLSEPSGSDTFNIKLNTQPTGGHDVDITTITASNSQCTVSAANTTIANADWNTGATITVEAVNDAVADGSQTCTINVGTSNSSDATYHNLDPTDVTVTVNDNDTAGATVSPTSGLTISEPSGTANFTVSLASQPAADVTIGLSTPSGECSAAAASVINAGNYNTGVNVIVTATDDNAADGNQTCNVVTSFSGDAVYAAINPDDVTVTVNDDDTAGVTIGTPSSATEGGATGSYTVTLDAAPTSGNVTVSVTPSAQCTVGAGSVTLNAGTMFDTVTVTAVDDAIIEGEHSCSISHAVTSGPAEYPTSMDVNPATVTLVDNNPGVIIRHSASNTAVAEGGATDSFEVLLSTIANVDVTLTPDAQLDLGSGAGAAHTINLSAANTPTTVTVTAVDDSAVEGTHSSTISLSSTSSTGTYNPAAFVIEGANTTAVVSLTVQITDNDANSSGGGGSSDSGKLYTAVEGQGTVVVLPAGISCGDNCYDLGGTVGTYLTAIAAEGYVFSHWSGDCSGTDGSNYYLLVSDINNCTAIFTLENTSNITNKAAYYIPSPNLTGMAYIRITNPTNNTVPVRGTLYNQDGTPLGIRNRVLTDELAAQATLVFSAQQLAQLFAPWSNLAWLELTYPAELKVMNLMRNASTTLTNLSATSHSGVYLLPRSQAVDTVSLMVINRHEQAVDVYANLYQQNGTRLGSLNSPLLLGLAPKSLTVLTAIQLEALFGNWQKRARLEIVNPDSGVHFLNVVLSSTGDVTNFTHTNQHAAYNIPRTTAIDTAYLRITNLSANSANLTGMLYHQYGQILGAANATLANLAPHATVVLTAQDLERQFGTATWDKRARLVINQPTTDLRILATLRSPSGTLTNATLVLDNTAYNLPGSASIDTAYVRLTNTLGTETPVVGTVYHEDGRILGTGTLGTLAADETRVLDMPTLEQLVGSGVWDKRARLVITQPVVGIKVMSMVRAPSGTLTNLSGVQ